MSKTHSTEGPICPNPECGRQFTADESYYYAETDYTEETCDQCGETFDVEVYISTSWTCGRREPADAMMEARK